MLQARFLASECANCQDHLPARLKRCLVSQDVLSNVAPQMAESMGHFKLVGSYRPRRRLQYLKEVAESLVSHTKFPS